MSSSQATTTMPEGQELLDGLYTVQSYLQASINKQNEFWALERQFRNKSSYLAKKEKMDTSSVSGKSRYTFFCVGVSVALFTGVVSIYGGGIGMFIFSLVIVGLFTYGKIKDNSKVFKIGAILLAYLVLTWLLGFISVIRFSLNYGNWPATVFYLAVNAICFLVAFFICRFFLKKFNAGIDKQNEAIHEMNKQIDIKNNEIRKSNEAVTAQRQQIAVEINSINKEMCDATSSWYPPDYYALEVVERFIFIVRNHEADTVKEMIAVYKTDAYRSADLLSKQEFYQQVKAKFDQHLNNQQQMIQLSRKQNVLQMGSFIANMATAINTSTIASNTSSIAKDADYMARNLGAGYW